VLLLRLIFFFPNLLLKNVVTLFIKPDFGVLGVPGDSGVRAVISRSMLAIFELNGVAGVMGVLRKGSTLQK